VTNHATDFFVMVNRSGPTCATSHRDDVGAVAELEETSKRDRPELVRLLAKSHQAVRFDGEVPTTCAKGS